MWLKTSCDLTFEISVPTPFILMLRPRSVGSQWVASEEYRISSGVSVSECTDIYGNLCQRLIAPPGIFEIRTTAEVRIADFAEQSPGAAFVEIPYLPDSVLHFLLPSRYCESDRFGDMASSITEGQKPGYDQVLAIENWLRNNIKYEPGSSNLPLSAVDVNLRQSGVCRDLAHLGIALCRSLSIPARMVVGYLYKLEPMDLHAWFEAYVGGKWYTFDAVPTGPKGGYVVVGFGRDAADVAISNQFGPAAYPTKQVVRVEQIEQRF